MEFTIKSSLKVRTVRGKGENHRHTLTRMVLGCDSSVTYSAHPIKLEARECSDSPFGYNPSASDMGVYSNRSLLSDFCLSSDSKMDAIKKFFVGDFSKDSLTSWTTKHPQNWTKKEVLDWVYYVVEQENLDGGSVKGEAFSNFTGLHLMKMGREGFLAADPINGLKFYQTFRNLVNNVIIEEPRHAPFHSTLHTFNQDNHLHVKNLTLEICNGVFGESNRGAPKNSQVHAPETEILQLPSRDLFLPWRPAQRARHNSARSLSINHGSFSAEGRDKTPSREGTNDDLVVYEMGGDFKVVGLQGLGTYPIDHDFSPSFSSLASSLNQSQAFTAPISPICSSPSLPQFEFNEQLPRSAHDSCSPATPPPSVRGSLSSPSSCSHPSSSWFPSLNSEHLKRQHYNNSAICSGRNRPLLLPASLSEANGFVPCDSMPASSDGLIPSSSLSTNASYRYQKTMTATLCKQKVAGHDSTNQQMKSHTISSSWTISSSSSSLSPSPFFKQQENNFLSPSLSPSPSVWRENPAGPSMSPSSSIWRDDTAPSEPDDVASSLMPPRISEDESIYTETLGEDVIAMDYDPLDSSEVKKKSPRRNRNNSAKTGNHLWEFVRDLLRDPKFNPKLLKWEDKENGVFRFVQSEQVARLWGKKKNNPMMTYEKLSRAMRFCRKTGFFNAVPRTGKFPKKLCFMFGDKAHGWRD